MEETNTARNWTIIGALVVLVGLVAWFYSGGTGTAPTVGTGDAMETAPAADAPAADAPAADAPAADAPAADAPAAEPAPADGTEAPADGAAAPAEPATNP